jgi:diketogulonate reductase-like aldo/keto reductase
VSPTNEWTTPVPIKEIRQTALESVKKLGRKPQLYLIHSPQSVPTGSIADAWKIFEDLKDEGILE